MTLPTRRSESAPASVTAGMVFGFLTDG
jgi:hypothetical protein